MTDFKSLALKELIDNFETYKNNVDYLVYLGENFFDSGNWSKATECVHMALDIDGNFSDALVLLAKIQEAQGDILGSIELLTKLTHSKSSVVIHRKLSSLYLILEDYGKSLSELEIACVLSPNDDELLMEKCNLLEKNKQYENCEQVYKNLININRKKYLLEYAFFLRRIGKYKDSKSKFIELSQLLDNNDYLLSSQIKKYIEEDDFSMPKFKVAARLITQLGEFMIENEVVALSELVKNAYDAKSPGVSIVVDTEYEEQGRKIGKIEINDTGTGMTKDIIENCWLLISTSSKFHQKKQLTGDKVPLGEKGIGRLSAHRLGHKLVVETSVEGIAKKTYLEVDWEKFEHNMDDPIESVDAILSQNAEDSDKHYTNLTITKLKSPDFWKKILSDSEQQSILKKALFSLISPFKELQNDFVMNIEVNGTPLTPPSIDSDFLEIISTSKLELDFNLNTDKNEWEARIDISFSPEFYALKAEKHIKKLAQDCGEYWVTKYLDLLNLPKRKVNIPTIIWSQDVLIERIKELWDVKLFGFKSPGPFKMIVYGYTRSYKELIEEKLTEKVQEGLAELYGLNANKQVSAKSFFDSIQGVKIYRDGFRVFPYGEKGNDWLGLDEYVTTVFRNALKFSDTTGYVALSGKYNSNLKEKTNREGFISDAYTNIFLQICRKSMREINDKIKDIDADLRNAFIKVNNEFIQIIEEEKKKKEKEVKLLEDSLKSAITPDTSMSDLTSNANIAVTALKYTETAKQQIVSTQAKATALETKIENIMIDMADIIELSSLGMLVEAFTHEFELQNSKVYSGIDRIGKQYSNDQNLKRLLSKLQSTVNILDGYVKYLKPSRQNERKRRVRLDLIALLNSMYGEHSISFIASRAKRNNIKINIQGDDNFVILGNQGLLIQVFDNLYLNSEYWLNYAENLKLISNKEVIFHIDSTNKKVIVWDNGKGIDPLIENSLFSAFKTTKPDGDGRGLGLYITKNVLGILKATIYLDPERNEFQRKYKFIIDFSDNGV